MLRLEARKPHSRRVRSHVADALPNADRAFIRDLIPCLDSARLDLRNGVEGRRSFSTTEPFVHQKAQQLARTERPPLRARAAGRLVFGGQSGLDAGASPRAAGPAHSADDSGSTSRSTEGASRGRLRSSARGACPRPFPMPSTLWRVMPVMQRSDTSSDRLGSPFAELVFIRQQRPHARAL